MYIITMYRNLRSKLSTTKIAWTSKIVAYCKAGARLTTGTIENPDARTASPWKRPARTRGPVGIDSYAGNPKSENIHQLKELHKYRERTENYEADPFYGTK